MTRNICHTVRNYKAFASRKLHLLSHSIPVDYAAGEPFMYAFFKKPTHGGYSILKDAHFTALKSTAWAQKTCPPYTAVLGNDCLQEPGMRVVLFIGWVCVPRLFGVDRSGFLSGVALPRAGIAVDSSLRVMLQVIKVLSQRVDCWQDARHRPVPFVTIALLAPTTIAKDDRPFFLRICFEIYTGMFLNTPC